MIDGVVLLLSVISVTDVHVSWDVSTVRKGILGDAAIPVAKLSCALLHLLYPCAMLVPSVQ